MACTHVSKKGIKCKHPALKNSKACYLKSHHGSKMDYKQAVDNLKRGWIEETYPIDLFSKFNVSEDGWCFYASFGMAILNRFKNKTTNEKIKSFFNQSDFEPFVKSKDWDNQKFKELLAYKLFYKARSWLKNHLCDVHDETKESIHDFIINMNDVDTIDKYFSEDSDNVDSKEELSEEHWGGVCEQYALSKYFEIDVIIFFPTRYSFSREEKQYKLMISKVVRKNITRYKLSSCCFNGTPSNKSTILSILKSASEHKIDTANFFQTLPDNLKEKIQTDLNNTIFLLLYILSDNDENISHYNYLLFKENTYLKN